MQLKTAMKSKTKIKRIDKPDGPETNEPPPNLDLKRKSRRRKPRSNLEALRRRYCWVENGDDPE